MAKIKNQACNMPLGIAKNSYDLKYNNSISSLLATNVQEALTEIDNKSLSKVAIGNEDANEVGCMWIEEVIE